MKVYLSLSLILVSTLAFVGCPSTTSAPTVISTSPQNGSVDLPVNIAINATFSEAMDIASINTSTFMLTKAAADGSQASVPGMVTLAGQVGNFKPTADLDPGTKYTATITTGAKSARGTVLASNYVWTFTTVAAQAGEVAPAGSAAPARRATGAAEQQEPQDEAIAVRVQRPPPPMPVYVQPRIPQVGAGYIWTPGYWAWNASVADYYWVPGTWVRGPRPGLYWTPGYWALVGGVYVWHAGYWGPTVGFYGRINYGFGYTGSGYNGGQWRGQQFTYNNSVNNITTNNITNVNVRNVNVINSFSTAAPTTQVERQSLTIRQQLASGRAPQGVLAAERTQITHERTARTVPTLRASQNAGKPPVAATVQPVAVERDLTSGKGVVPATKATGPVVPRVAPGSKKAVPPGRERKAAPVQKMAPTPKAAPAPKAAPVKKVAPGKAAKAQKAAPAPKAAPERKAAQGRKAAPSQKAAPVQKAGPAQKVAPAQKAAPQRKAAPAGKQAKDTKDVQKGKKPAKPAKPGKPGKDAGPAVQKQ